MKITFICEECKDKYSLMETILCGGKCLRYSCRQNKTLTEIDNESNFGNIPFEDGTYFFKGGLPNGGIIKVKDCKIVHIENFEFEKIKEEK